MVQSQCRSVVGLPLEQKSWLYWLSLLPVAVPSLFWVGGHILCDSALAPTQKRQALLLSQPLNYFRSWLERMRDGITGMKQSACSDYTTSSLFENEKTNQIQIPSYILNQAFSM